jgi:dihydroflavonol-4-reductase
MVTGATGYIAGWIVKGLLEAGCCVHAAVRDPDNLEKVKPLDQLAEELPGTIRYFQSDLLDEGSYEEAMQGCEVVYHTASPFLLHFDDPQKELIEPALKGTRNVLNSVNATQSVRRVVLTSSCAAVYGDNADIADAKGEQFSEDDWNTTSSLDHKPYSYSKTLAERAAWEMAGVQDRWDLVTINPSLVLGPGIGSQTSSGSFELVRNIGDGTLKVGVPSYPFGAVDVREVAQAHLNAGTDLSVESGRYILSGHDTDMPEIVAILKRHFGDAYPFPRRTLTKWLTWLVAPLVDKSMTRKLIALNVGVPAGFDNRKSRDELGIEYRPLEESVIEMFQQLIRDGVIT